MTNYYSSCKGNLSLASPPLMAGFRTTHWLSLKQLNQHVITWYQRAKQRRQLAQLDDRMLKDIGVTPMQARCEARKPFWVE